MRLPTAPPKKKPHTGLLSSRRRRFGHGLLCYLNLTRACFSLCCCVRRSIFEVCWLRFSSGFHRSFAVVTKWVRTTIFGGRPNVPSCASGAIVSRFTWLEKDRWLEHRRSMVCCFEGVVVFGFVWLWGLFWL